MSIVSLLRFEIERVPMYPGLFASPDGIIFRNNWRNPRVLIPVKPYVGCTGYPVVGWNRGRSIPQCVHWLVAATYLPEPLPDQIIRHLDGNKLNNRVDNLRWGTYKENYEDTVVHRRVPLGSNHKNAKVDEVDVGEISQRLEAGERITYVAREYGLTHTTVQRMRERKTWKHV